MTMVATFIETIFGGIAVILVIVAIMSFKKGSHLTFEGYKQLHPSHIRNGRVSCYSCGGAGVTIRRIGNGLGYILNSHVCRQCGTELYRSKTRL